MTQARINIIPGRGKLEPYFEKAEAAANNRANQVNE
jgi:hypothetical protein